MADRCSECNYLMDPDFVKCPRCGRPRRRAEGQAHPAERPKERRGSTTGDPKRIPSRDLALLVIKHGGSRGKDFSLGEVTNIGRDPGDNEVVLDDPKVSGHHARIKYENGGFFLYDLASLRGSWIDEGRGNRRKITAPKRLTHGDVLHLGDTRLAFMQAGK